MSFWPSLLLIRAEQPGTSFRLLRGGGTTAYQRSNIPLICTFRTCNEYSTINGSWPIRNDRSLNFHSGRWDGPASCLISPRRWPDLTWPQPQSGMSETSGNDIQLVFSLRFQNYEIKKTEIWLHQLIFLGTQAASYPWRTLHGGTAAAAGHWLSQTRYATLHLSNTRTHKVSHKE